MNQVPSHAREQWQQARALLGAGKTAESLPYLEAAATELHPAACFQLGCLHLFRLVETPNRQHGLALISQAADLGHGAASYQLAVIELCKPNALPNWQYVNECLAKSAQLGDPTALRTLALHWSRSTERSIVQLGTQCLEYAAQAGDIISLALLMHRLYAGVGCAKNNLRASAINTLLMQSPLPIEPPASPMHAHFAQAPSLAPLPELPLPRLQDDLCQAKIEMISESPWVAISDNLLTDEECHLLRYLGAPQLRPSITATPDGQRLQVQLRTSFDMQFDEIQEDIDLLLIQRRMAAMVDTTPAYSEYLQMLRYQNGQEYRPHRDYLPPGLIVPIEQGGSGQRESTVIIYLNDVAAGGETEFIELGKKISPRVGRALAFKNLHTDGSPDSRTLHAGLPVTLGSKWIATLWIHQGIERK